jgi:hypothetical protein
MRMQRGPALALDDASIELDEASTGIGSGMTLGPKSGSELP